MSTFSKADRNAQWWDNKWGWDIFAPNCGVIHSTEGVSWPDYQGGSMAPNYTAMPNFATKTLNWRAHFEDEHSSRGLADIPGGVRTNVNGDIQIELIGTCDPQYRERWFNWVVNRDYIFWPEAPDWALRGVAEFMVDMYKRHGIQLISPVAAWNAYPLSAGYKAPQRMSSAQWTKFYGWCGHQHVPENDHGDPGAFPIGTVLQIAKSLISGPVPTVKPAPSVTPAPISNEVEVSHVILNGPVTWAPIVVPNDHREYQIDLSFACGQSPRNITIATWARKSTVGTPSAQVRNLTYKWERDVPGTIKLGATEGHVSVSFDGTPDQKLSIALTPTGKTF